MNQKPIIKRANLHVPFETADRDSVIDFATHVGDWSEHNGQAHKFAPGDPILARDASRPRNPRHDGLDDPLSKHQFLKQLHREKRRADRSKASLSIALFKFNGREVDVGPGAKELLKLVRGNMRETDLLGDLDDGRAAVLLTDTNVQGAKRFMHKLVDQADGLQFSITTGTYPDLLFEGLAKEDREGLHLQPLLLDESDTPNKLWRLLKRVLDIVGATTLIVTLAPFMLIVAMIIAMTSRGPVIFKQIRLGQRGERFAFYKFRSMYSNADDRMHREYVISLIKGGQEEGERGGKKPWSKMESDPRITPVGRFLRRTSIDELPQLFNVLRGDLSLIGPRPPLPYEVENYESWHLRRIMETKPGISGLWQVESRGQSTFEDMVRMDLRYIRDWSIKLDLRILAKTVKIVLRRNGAG